MDQRAEIVNLEHLFSELELRKAAALYRGNPAPDFWNKRELATYLILVAGWYPSKVREALVVK